MTANADQIAYWNDVAAPVWIAEQAKIDALMAPLTEVLLQEAVPKPGESVFEIGCGCGELSYRLAAAVGPRGRVRALDVSKPMLAHARAQEKASPDAARIEWIDGDASDHPFEPDTDLLISRFGVMFFADRRQGFANLRKALKPAARLAFMTWRRRAEVEWMQKSLDWIAPVLPTPEPTDGEPGPFGLADGEKTRVELEDSGFWDVIAEPVDRLLTIAPSVDEAIALLSRVGAASRLMREADDGKRAEAQTLLREGLAGVADADGAVKMRGACWIYRGVAGAS